MYFKAIIHHHSADFICWIFGLNINESFLFLCSLHFCVGQVSSQSLGLFLRLWFARFGLR